MKVVNLEIDYPTVEEAMKKFEDHLNAWKKEILFKVIHGYGSTGVGGKIQKRLERVLEQLKKEGKIVDYIPGDSFTVARGKIDVINTYRSLLKQDRDYQKSNEGITYVILKKMG